ncbi:MAG: dihydroneopterin aldolase [Cyanobacteria bacterium P01_H01_bin.15]
MDTIEIQNIRAYGYTGYLSAEQTLGQWFSVDLSLFLDLQSAGSSDKLSDTVDYRDAIQRVKTHIQTQRYALVEKLADAIASELISVLPSLHKLRVRLTKEAPPIPDFGGQIVIDITRSLSAYTSLTRGS